MSDIACLCGYYPGVYIMFVSACMVTDACISNVPIENTRVERKVECVL